MKKHDESMNIDKRNDNKITYENKAVKSSSYNRKIKKRRRRKKIQKLLATVIILALAGGAIVVAANSDFLRELVDRSEKLPESSIPQTGIPDETNYESPEPELTARATIGFVGDILMHESLIDGGLREDGSYDYNYMFREISEVIQGIDYAIADYEGVLNGPPYSGWPYFNAPDAIAYAIKNAGFDMVTTANNHSYDMGMSGLVRTPEVFRGLGVKVIGTRSTTQDPRFKLVDINGIRVGFSAYTYETVGTEENRALNAIPMHENAYELIDSFNPYRPERFEQDKKDIAQRARDMREAGAEVVVFAMHWGDEYHTSSNFWQQELAQVLADEGVDIIFGCHPHVIQEISVVKSEKSGRNTLVYYSVGNFISNMGFNANEGRTQGKAEDGIVAKAEIKRDQDGNITVEKGGFIPVYVIKDDSSGTRIHRVIPARKALENPLKYEVEGFEQLIRDSLERTSKFLEPYTGNIHGIEIGEYNG